MADKTWGDREGRYIAAELFASAENLPIFEFEDAEGYVDDYLRLIDVYEWFCAHLVDVGPIEDDA